MTTFHDVHTDTLLGEQSSRRLNELSSTVIVYFEDTHSAEYGVMMAGYSPIEFSILDRLHHNHKDSVREVC